MSVKLGDVAKEAFGEVQVVEVSDERWKELTEEWEAVGEQGKGDSFFGEELAKAEDLDKQQCTW